MRKFKLKKLELFTNHNFYTWGSDLNIHANYTYVCSNKELIYSDYYDRTTLGYPETLEEAQKLVDEHHSNEFHSILEVLIEPEPTFEWKDITPDTEIPDAKHATQVLMLYRPTRDNLVDRKGGNGPFLSVQATYKPGGTSDEDVVWGFIIVPDHLIRNGFTKYCILEAPSFG